MDTKECYQRVKSATVAICIHQSDGTLIPFGTGVNVDPKGVLVTCTHVIEGAQVAHDAEGNPPSFPRPANGVNSIEMPMHDVVAVFTVLERDHIEMVVCRLPFIHGMHNLDIAVCRLMPDEPLPSVPLGDSDLVFEGEKVFTCGFPLGNILQPVDPIGSLLISGIISGIRPHHLVTPRRELLLDMNINPGNSGGPLSTDTSGNIIGIVNARINHKGLPTGIGCAIPSNLIKPIAERISAVSEKDLEEIRTGQVPAWLLEASSGQ